MRKSMKSNTQWVKEIGFVIVLAMPRVELDSCQSPIPTLALPEALTPLVKITKLPFPPPTFNPL